MFPQSVQFRCTQWANEQWLLSACIVKYICSDSYYFIDIAKTSTVGRLFSRTTIFAYFVNFLFYMKIVSPKYNIYARINHNHISGSP